MSDFTFRTGKHKGQTKDWVKSNDPNYYSWVKENRPEMLKGPKSTNKVVNDYKPSPITPNLNFDNETE